MQDRKILSQMYILIGREANLIRLWKELRSEYINTLFKIHGFGMVEKVGEAEKLAEYNRKLEEAMKMLEEWK